MLERIHVVLLSLTDLRAERRSERGATATEYSLLVAFIVFAIVLGVTFFGDQLGVLFGDLGAPIIGWPN